MQMKRLSILATIVIGLALVGCKEKAVEPTAGSQSTSTKLTGKTENAGDNQAVQPVTK